MDFFSQLFTDLNTTDSLLLLLFLFLSFLIGLFTGRASTRGALRKAQKKVQHQESELIKLHTEHATVQEQLTNRELDLQSTQENLAQTETQLKTARQSILQHQDTQQDNEEKIRNHEELGEAYRNKISELEGHSSTSQNGEDEYLQQIAQLQEELAQLTAQNQKRLQNHGLSKEENQSPSTALPIARLAAIEEKMNFLESENQELQLAVEALRGMETAGVEEIEIDLGLEEEEGVDQPETYDFISGKEKATRAKNRLQKLYGHKIPIATADQKDRLQDLNGIGPFIEEQLNGIGIYTFQQISQFDAAIIELVTEAIQFFPGRIARDQWKEQAARKMI